MATYVVGLILLVLLFAAARRICRNFASGSHDCCGCNACHASKEESVHKEKAVCCSHK